MYFVDYEERSGRRFYAVFHYGESYFEKIQDSPFLPDEFINNLLCDLLNRLYDRSMKLNSINSEDSCL